MVDDNLNKVAESHRVSSHVTLSRGDVVLGKEGENLNVRRCYSLNQAVESGRQTVANSTLTKDSIYPVVNFLVRDVQAEGAYKQDSCGHRVDLRHDIGFTAFLGEDVVEALNSSSDSCLGDLDQVFKFAFVESGRNCFATIFPVLVRISKKNGLAGEAIRNLLDEGVLVEVLVLCSVELTDDDWVMDNQCSSVG